MCRVRCAFPKYGLGGAKIGDAFRRRELSIDLGDQLATFVRTPLRLTETCQAERRAELKGERSARARDVDCFEVKTFRLSNTRLDVHVAARSLCDAHEQQVGLNAQDVGVPQVFARLRSNRQALFNGGEGVVEPPKCSERFRAVATELRKRDESSDRQQHIGCAFDLSEAALGLIEMPESGAMVVQVP